MTFSPLSISFYITFLTLMFPSSHVAGGFLDGKGKSKMYQQITFQQTQTSPSKDHTTLRVVTYRTDYEKQTNFHPVELTTIRVVTSH